MSNKLIMIQDDDRNPRDDDNLTKMVCFHKRYNLGDKHDYDTNDYNSWEELKEAIMKKEDVAIIEPLYLYDHSGITISTTPFSCRWDSGQVGFVFVTKENARKNFLVKKVTKKIIQQCETVLKGEVEEYDICLRGECYGYILQDEDGEEIDSCWGFLGSDYKTNGMADNISRELLENVTVEFKYD